MSRIRVRPFRLSGYMGQRKALSTGVAFYRHLCRPVVTGTASSSGDLTGQAAGADKCRTIQHQAPGGGETDGPYSNLTLIRQLLDACLKQATSGTAFGDSIHIH